VIPAARAAVSVAVPYSSVPQMNSVFVFGLALQYLAMVNCHIHTTGLTNLANVSALRTLLEEC